MLIVRCSFQSSNCGLWIPCFDEDDNLIISHYTCDNDDDCDVKAYTVGDQELLYSYRKQIWDRQWAFKWNLELKIHQL